jgi:2-iminobutanoate/2-iminopropanoate deaminase
MKKKLSFIFALSFACLCAQSFALTNTSTEKLYPPTVNAFAPSNDTDSPYRQAGPFIYISSQVPIDPVTHQLVSRNIDQQVKQVLDNLRAQVLASGAKMTDVIKITVFMDDIDSVFPVVKQYIPDYFSTPYPARSPIGGVSFGNAGFKIAIDAVVYVK